MAVLRMTAAVRRAVGVEDVRKLQAGLTLPERVQCYKCHGYIVTAETAEVELSAVQVAPTLYITTWSHGGCAQSRVLTATEFEQAATRIEAAPGLAFGLRDDTPDRDSGESVTSLIVDGRPVNL